MPAQNVKTFRRVAIVGAGVISPLGFGLGETMAALRDGRDCVTPVEAFDVSRCRCSTAGQVSDSRLRKLNLNLRKPGRLHRASHMMAAALQEALQGLSRFQPELSVFGTTSGGMSFGEEYYRRLAQRTDLRGMAARIANYPPQKPVIDAQESVGLSVPTQVIANACASGTNAIGHAFMCIRSGHYRQILTGGYDAISELVFVGFDSLQAATREKCRPFDRNRSGLVLGEGAAVLALEDWESAEAGGRQILAEITGYGISTDNHHLTQPDPSGCGPLRSMQGALELAGIPGSEIDYINAHGTATPFNDAAEGKAIAEVAPASPVSSTKSMMGHSLGAAGAIEAVISLLALQEQFLPPNINYATPEPGLSLEIVANQGRPAKINRVLSNSFGFGGTNATLLLERIAA